MEQLVARQAHNLQAAGSSPAPATKTQGMSKAETKNVLRVTALFLAWLGYCRLSAHAAVLLPDWAAPIAFLILIVIGCVALFFALEYSFNRLKKDKINEVRNQV